MKMMRRAFQFPYFSKCCNCISISRHILINNQIKKIHSTVNVNVKMYMENENKYAYEVMQNIGYVNVLNMEKKKVEPMTNEEFESIQSRNWSKEPQHVLFQTLSRLGMYCSQNNICISNNLFDDYIDNLTDKIKFATDEELKTLFHSLLQFPSTESIKTRNYIEIWAALDDECFNRINKWSFDEMLKFLSLFYMLNVIRASDYSYKCLLKLAYKAKQLTKSQVVQTYFFIGTARKSPKDIHNLEIYVQDQFSQFSTDDLAIIAMGLFKSKTPIRSMVLISNIIEKIVKNSKHIHEVSLASLLKIIRYSMKITADNKIYELLKSLQYEIPRLSIMCNVHLALVGTSTLVLHENCLTKIAEKMQASMSDARLKDLERIALTYGTFNFIPQTKTCFISQILDELRKPDRTEEIKKHGRSFSCCVAYLGLLGIYPQDLMDIILSKEFLENAYGKTCYQFGREILCIHNTAKIFLKHENMNLLKDTHVNVLSKKYTDYIPSESYQKAYNVSERMFLDVKRVLQLMRGGKDFVTGHHIVTHHQRGDIIICNDHEGKPLPVREAFSKSQFGLLCPPPDENIWTALIIAGRNTMIHNSTSATGQFTSKVRELKTLGYNAVIVMWNVYDKLTNNEEKIKYLNRLIQDSVNTKLQDEYIVK